MEPDDAFHPKTNFNPKPWDERNDTLQSTVGPDRANRPSKVITVARNLSEFDRLSPKDPPHEGKRTQSLKRFSFNLRLLADQSPLTVPEGSSD